MKEALQQHDVEGDPFFAVWKMDQQRATSLVSMARVC